MNKDKYVFAQLVEFLDNNKFRHFWSTSARLVPCGCYKPFLNS